MIVQLQEVLIINNSTAHLLPLLQEVGRETYNFKLAWPNMTLVYEEKKVCVHTHVCGAQGGDNLLGECELALFWDRELVSTSEGVTVIILRLL